jgi:hypothetical protein
MLNHTGDRKVLQAKNGVPAQTPKHDQQVIPATTYRPGGSLPEQTIPAQRFDILPIELPGNARSQGSAFAHLDPAPLRLPSYQGADPRQSDALWRFEYTGNLSVNQSRSTGSSARTAPGCWRASKTTPTIASGPTCCRPLTVTRRSRIRARPPG